MDTWIELLLQLQAIRAIFNYLLDGAKKFTVNNLRKGYFLTERYKHVVFSTVDANQE